MDDTLADSRSNRHGLRRHARLDTNRPRREPMGEGPARVRDEAPPVPSDAFLQIDVRGLFGHVTRNLKAIILCGVAGAVIAVGAGMLMAPRYTVSTEILVDPTNLKVVADDIYSTNDQRDAMALNVESKLRVLTSRNVLGTVVDELNLEADPEFVPPPGPLDPRRLLGRASDSSPRLVALQQLGSRVHASRDERSFVVTMTVSSDNPEKSVVIANSVFSAFERELARADSAGAGQAATELDSRLAQLRQEVADAENATEAFRSGSGLQDSGGQLISTQKMGQLTNQLADARRALTDASARYEDLAAGGQSALNSSAAQASATLTSLLAQQATARQEADTLARTMGPRHPRVLTAQAQLATLSAQVDAEISRVVAVAEADLRQAQAVVTKLEAELTKAQSKVSQDNQAQVHLRELERDAAAKAAIYEAFMSRARQLTEREQIDSTNVRVISEPVPPLERSWPPRNVQLAVLGAAFGVALGAATALLLGATGWRLGRRRSRA